MVQDIFRDKEPSYFERFRATFILVRIEGKDKLHSKITVRRTGEIHGKLILKLSAERFELDHVRSVFRPEELSSNGSDWFVLDFGAAWFPDGETEYGDIFFQSCTRVSLCVADLLYQEQCNDT